MTGKEKGRRSWDGGPWGLLLLQSTGRAAGPTGRPSAKAISDSIQRAILNGDVCSSFLALLSFFAFFTGFAVFFT
jgi:hypothetical protein